MRVSSTYKFLNTGVLFKSLAIALLLPLTVVHVAQSQTRTATEYQVKAVFLYNFTRFVEWPPATYENPNAPFVIGVVGKDPFGNLLEDAVAGEKIGTHPIIVKRFKSANEIDNCHILYINSSDADEIKRILSAVENKNILTVSDSYNFVRWGGIVRFYTENNKIRLQINATAAKSAHLNISSKLLSVAQVN